MKPLNSLYALFKYQFEHITVLSLTSNAPAARIIPTRTSGHIFSKCILPLHSLSLTISLAVCAHLNFHLLWKMPGAFLI